MGTVGTRGGLAPQLHGAFGALGNQGLEVGGEFRGRQGGIAHGEMKKGFAKDGVLECGVARGGTHGADGFAAETGNAVEGGGSGGLAGRAVLGCDGISCHDAGDYLF